MKFADIFKITWGGFKIYLSDYKGFINLSNEGQLRGAKDVLHYLNYTFRGWKTGVNIPNSVYEELEQSDLLKFDGDYWYFSEKIRIDFQNEESK